MQRHGRLRREAGGGVDGLTRKINILLSVILILCAVGFLYTFVQPRYTATIVSIGRTRTVSSSGKHGQRSHKVVPMVVTFTDPRRGGADRRRALPMGK